MPRKARGSVSGQGLHIVATQLRRGVTSLARRLWAAWLSSRKGLKGVDYMLDKVGDEEPTERNPFASPPGVRPEKSGEKTLPFLSVPSAVT